MSKTSREKGKRGEREACDLLRALYPKVHTKRAGGESASEDRGRDLLGTPGICVQVKLRARIDSSMVDEALEASQPWEIPIVLARQPRKRWIAVMSEASLMALLKYRIQSQTAATVGNPIAEAAGCGSGDDHTGHSVAKSAPHQPKLGSGKKPGGERSP